MNEHTEIFIALGAATAANCGPCFEHYFSRAEKLGIGKEDIQKNCGYCGQGSRRGTHGHERSYP